MHKKLEAELIHLAHQVIKMNNTTDINALQHKARLIYENLSVLAFIDNYFVDTPEVTDSKDDFLESLNQLINKKVVNKEDKSRSNLVSKTQEKNSFIEEPPKKVEISVKKTPKPVVKETPKIKEVVRNEKAETELLIKKTLATVKTEAKQIASKIEEKAQVIIPKTEEKVQVTSPKVEAKRTLEDEMKDSISADVAANMFERAEKNFSSFPSTSNIGKTKVEKENIPSSAAKTEKPKVNIATKQGVFKPKPIPTPPPTSLNDRIHNQKIQVGLNDRIAFVKHLFNFSQEDFNRVLSQLNSFSSEQECKDFLNTQVKPDYNWSNKEEYEERLIALIERKFK